MHVTNLNVFQHPNQNAEQTRNALTTLHASEKNVWILARPWHAALMRNVLSRDIELPAHVEEVSLEIPLLSAESVRIFLFQVWHILTLPPL